MKKFSDLKPFSREWFTNYWFYYKWHTIAGLFVLLLAAITVRDVVTRVKPDIDITIASQFVFPEETVDGLKSKFEAVIDDADGDGRKYIQFNSLNVAIPPKDEMQMAASQKLQLEFAAGDSFIFFMDKELFDIYDSEDMFITLKGGENYIPLREIPGLAEFDIINSDLALCVRNLRHDEKEAKFQNTEKIIKELGVTE
jgi:hypothetical protein